MTVSLNFAVNITSANMQKSILAYNSLNRIHVFYFIRKLFLAQY